MSHKMSKLANSRRGNHCSGIVIPHVFRGLEMVSACFVCCIQCEEESQWGTGLINALLSVVLLRHGCFLDTLGQWKLQKISARGCPESEQ